MQTIYKYTFALTIAILSLVGYNEYEAPVVSLETSEVDLNIIPTDSITILNDSLGTYQGDTFFIKDKAFVMPTDSI